MAYNVTLLELRTKIRQRADLVTNKKFITDPELNDWINDSIAELYDLLVTSFGEDYYHVIADPFSTVAGQALYPIDGTVITTGDFFKLAGLDVSLGGIWVPMKRFMPAERTRGQLANWSLSNYANARYRLNGSNLEFAPAPSGVFQVRQRHVPAAPKLTKDADTFDSINAWHMYVVWDVAGQALEKSDRDSSAAIARKMEQKQRIESASKNRDTVEPNRVVDVTGLLDNSTDDYFDSWR